MNKNNQNSCSKCIDGSIPDQDHREQRNQDQVIISYIGDSPFGKTSFLRRLQNEGGFQANPIDTLISKK